MGVGGQLTSVLVTLAEGGCCEVER